MMHPSETFKAQRDELPKILTWVQTQLEQIPFEPTPRKHVELALEEAIVNIIEHGAKNTQFDLTLICRFEPNRQVEFEITDTGPPFNPLQHPEPPTDIPLEERKPGGLGLSIMRKCMDALFYHRESDQNILTLVKNL